MKNGQWTIGNSKCRSGFSLVESAIAIVVVGVGLVALMSSLGAGTQSNAGSRQLTTATFLAQEVREWTLRLPFRDPDPADHNNPPGPDGSDPQVFVDDLDDLMDVTYSPPRDGQGHAIDELAGWSQTITMTWRDPAHLAAGPVTPGASDVIYVQVEIQYQGKHELTASWLVANKGT